jgi:hypothetical protein
VRRFRAGFGALWLLVVAASGTARAGAYSYPAGQGQVIVAAVFTQAGRQFDLSGKFIPTDRFRKLEAEAYIEYGLTDWLTAVIKPFGGKQGFGAGSLGSLYPASAVGAEVGARVHVATLGSITFAVQADGIMPGRGLSPNATLLSDGDAGARLSALATWNFRLGAWPSFVDLDVGYRWYADRLPDEWHGDVTIGIRPWPRLLVLLQSFNTGPAPGAGPRSLAYRQDKLAASLVYDLGAWSIQGGFLTTVAGMNAPAEQGVLLALWRRF